MQTDVFDIDQADVWILLDRGCNVLLQSPILLLVRNGNLIREPTHEADRCILATVRLGAGAAENASAPLYQDVDGDSNGDVTFSLREEHLGQKIAELSKQLGLAEEES